MGGLRQLPLDRAVMLRAGRGLSDGTAGGSHRCTPCFLVLQYLALHSRSICLFHRTSTPCGGFVAPAAPGRPNVNRDHAVVIGGSLTGLLAARVLTGHFDRVTLVERDRFPAGAAFRPGTPQS